MCVICNNPEEWRGYLERGTSYAAEVGVISHCLWKFVHDFYDSGEALKEIAHVHQKAAEMRDRFREEFSQPKDPVVSENKESMQVDG